MKTPEILINAAAFALLACPGLFLFLAGAFRLSFGLLSTLDGSQSAFVRFDSLLARLRWHAGLTIVGSAPGGLVRSTTVVLQITKP